MTAESAQFGVRAETNDDLDLVHASKNGDVAAFEQLVKRYDRKLFRIAHSVTHNREDSQDAVQEAFLKAYQHLAEFRGDSQFSTWLIRITLNQSLMKLRKQRRTRECSLDEDFGTDEDMLPREVIDWAPNPEELYSVSELRNILIKIIEELRPILRAVFVLQDLEGLSTDQTAEVLNLSQSAVKSRLWRARLQLRELLNKYFSKQGEPARVESNFLQTPDTSNATFSSPGCRSTKRQMIQQTRARASPPRCYCGALKELDKELTGEIFASKLSGLPQQRTERQQGGDSRMESQPSRRPVRLSTQFSVFSECLIRSISQNARSFLPSHRIASATTAPWNQYGMWIQQCMIQTDT